MIRLTAYVAACAIGLAACSAPPAPRPGPSALPSNGSTLRPIQTGSGISVAPPNAPSGPVVDNFARSFLNGLQAGSIAQRREVCGYIVVNSAGQLSATPPITGTFRGCDMPAPRPGQGIIASYHTHGAYDRGYDNEVPSVIDLVSDFQFGIDGYVSTPGGRVWLVDYQTRSTRQICGRGCVLSDPNFPNPERGGPVQPVYTLQALRQRQNSF